jgi:hypothetical protein
VSTERSPQRVRLDPVWLSRLGRLMFGALTGGVFVPTLGLAASLTNMPPVLPPPDALVNRVPLPDLLLKDKRTDSYFTGFPALGFDPESGFNYGAALQWFDNGPADSPYFRYTPYRQRLLLGATSSTGGSTHAAIGYDVPNINDSPWRIRAAALFERNKFQNYFGHGESTLGPLTYPGSSRTFHEFEEYTDALEQVVNGQTWARYNEFRKTQAGGVMMVERSTLGGWLRPLVGLQFNHVDVGDYTGEIVDGAVMQPTRLFTDQQAGRVLGFDGGWDNALKLGLTFDTRDFEPDPASGVMLQLIGRLSTEALGSEFDYQQLSLDGRVYHNLLSETGRLVVAGRLTYVMQFGDVPFYSASNIPYSEGDAHGLGGFSTLRGFVTDRFVGDAAAVAGAELRWSFGEATLWGQHLRFMVVPFVDSGRVFDSVGESTLDDWKIDGGVGLRLAWNLSTIVSFDYARSSEGDQFFMELGHQY